MVKSSGVKRTWLKSSSCLKTLFETSMVFEPRQHYLLATCDRLLLAHPKRAHSSRCTHTDWMKQIGDISSIFFFPSIMYPWHETMIISSFCMASSWSCCWYPYLVGGASSAMFHRCRLCSFSHCAGFNITLRENIARYFGVPVRVHSQRCASPGKQMVKTSCNES
jgi:hypothetical protein